MSLFAILILAQIKPAIDPNIARDWTAAAATGLESATLHLGRAGRFTLRSREKGKPAGTIQGVYTVGPASRDVAKGKMAMARLVQLFYDLASLRRVGMPKAEIDALAKKGKRHLLGMRLYFVPEVPVLTDFLSAHFIPTDDKVGATKRLAKWKPF